MFSKNKRIGILNDFSSKEHIEKYINYLVNWIKEKVSLAHAKGTIFGLSGGIDSALISVLCKKAFPDNSLGLIMPIDSMKHKDSDISSLIKAFNLTTKTIDLKLTFNTINKAIKVKNNLALSNIKPRLRMTTLYAYAQELNYLVVGTDNEDEYFIGYFTKYGDGGVDLLPIVHLLKSEVRILAKYLEIPQSIIDKKPSAGLWEGQNDEDELGFSYQDLDNFIAMDYDKINKNTKEKIERMHVNSEHKRNVPTKPLTIEEFFQENK